MGRSDTGTKGEDLALAWLSDHGLRLLERNWRSGRREIDLIMSSPGRIHIVEVKTLNAPLVMNPCEKVNALKQRNLVFAAQNFVRARRITGEVQFDVVSVVLDGDDAHVEYIPEAFYPVMNGF